MSGKRWDLKLDASDHQGHSGGGPLRFIDSDALNRHLPEPTQLGFRADSEVMNRLYSAQQVEFAKTALANNKESNKDDSKLKEEESNSDKYLQLAHVKGPPISSSSTSFDGSAYLTASVGGSGESAGKGSGQVNVPDKGFLDKKAWEVAMQPIQAAGMNIFMLYMMGSNPGIFGIMMLTYALSSGLTTLQNVNVVFVPYQQQGLDCSLQKIAYFAVSLAVNGYLLWSASGMGLLPTQSGDWISKIPGQLVVEQLL